jgi:hypothetical protein
MPFHRADDRSPAGRVSRVTRGGYLGCCVTDALIPLTSRRDTDRPRRVDYIDRFGYDELI